MTKEIKLIAEDIERLINRKVRSIENTNNEWKEKYEILVQNIKYHLDGAKEVCESFRDDGLSLNTIEGEGYYRGILTIYNLAKEPIEVEKDE